MSQNHTGRQPRNIGSSPCALLRLPRRLLGRRRGRPSGWPAAMRQPNYTGSAEKVVTLAPGALASAPLDIVDASAFSPSSCKPVPVRGLRVTRPVRGRPVHPAHAGRDMANAPSPPRHPALFIGYVQAGRPARRRQPALGQDPGGPPARACYLGWPGAGRAPVSMALVTAAVRPETPSLPLARSRCVFTVASLRNSSRPISALVMPARDQGRGPAVSRADSCSDRGAARPACGPSGGRPRRARARSRRAPRPAPCRRAPPRGVSFSR